MKLLIFILFLTITIHGCQSNADDKPPTKKQLEEQMRQERIRVNEENKRIAIERAKIYNSHLPPRPILKNYILDSKRPDIFLSRYIYESYRIPSTSVANLPGQIEIEFEGDAIIKKIRFEHNVLLKDKILELAEFANLIAENYNFTWSPIMDEENPSYAEFSYVQDSTLFFLSGEGKEVSYIDEKYEKQIKELNKEIKYLWKDGLQAWEVSKKEDYERKIYSLSHTIMITYIFEIANTNYVNRKQVEHDIKQYGEELKRIEQENLEKLEIKSQHLKDF